MEQVLRFGLPQWATSGRDLAISPISEWLRLLSEIDDAQVMLAVSAADIKEELARRRGVDADREGTSSTVSTVARLIPIRDRTPRSR